MTTYNDNLTREDKRALASLEFRFPGIIDAGKSAALKFACQVTGYPKSRYRLAENDKGFIAYVEIYTKLYHNGLRPFQFPVVPDGFNPNKNNKVTQEMPPHVFKSATECRQAAEAAELVLIKQVREMEDKARRGEEI